jgi:hypothetical protein
MIIIIIAIIVGATTLIAIININIIATVSFLALLPSARPQANEPSDRELTISSLAIEAMTAS